jgi:hypothetical protein
MTIRWKMTLTPGAASFNDDVVDSEGGVTGQLQLQDGSNGISAYG